MYDRPLCAGASGSVRVTQKHQSARCASVVQTFWPLMTHSSPSRTARVWTFERSEPAFGSEYPWHHISSTPWIFGRKRCFCSSEPYSIRVGAKRPSPNRLIRAGAPALAYSSLKITCSTIAGAAAAVLLRPRHPEPAVPAQQALPLDAQVPADLAEQPVAGAELGVLTDQVLTQPRAHLVAERRLGGSVAKVHRAGSTVLDRPVQFPSRPRRRLALVRNPEVP